jgi:Xaa-Pro aminopeptidase
MAAEPLPDPPALRHGRRERAFAAMEAHDLDVLVLGRVANIRYVSGVPLLWNAGTRPFGPGCVAVRDRGEVHLLSTWDEAVPEEIPHERLYGITWNPMNYVKVLQAIDAAPRRVGTDAMSPLFANLLPMAFPDAEIVDAGPALSAARRVKTDEEVAAIRAAVAIADTALAAAVAELRPGVAERDLTGVFMDAMASHGVTTPSTQDVVHITTATAGPGSRPGDAVVEAGDLVAFDAGVVADGYAGEVGRTWPVAPGERTAGLDDLYRRCDELWARLGDACRPGNPASALLDAYAAAGEPLPLAPVARGLGLGFDDPVVTRDLRETAARDRIDPGTVLVVTACVFDDELGSVIAHQPVHITADGPELLSCSPSWDHDRQGAPA